MFSVATASSVFVFDSSPLIAGCTFGVGGSSVAELVLAGSQVWIPPAVYSEVIHRGGSRPDALEAQRLVNAGRIGLAGAADVGPELADLQYYSLGNGDKESLTLTARIQTDAVLVTDDFLILVVAARLGLSHRLFLDHIVAQAISGALSVPVAKQVVQALSPRYPHGFVPHSLAMLDKLGP
jgi:hypothetical protein